jgi:secreted trypsin-like serine protease
MEYFLAIRADGLDQPPGVARKRVRGSLLRGGMPRLATATALVLVTGCAVTPATSANDQPIIGGQTTSTATYKTVVDLENGPGLWFCTGTLIDKDWALTAAHCVTGESASTIEIRFDADSINTGNTGHVVAVAEVHGDPQWDNDIAVIGLVQRRRVVGRAVS